MERSSHVQQRVPTAESWSPQSRFMGWGVLWIWITSFPFQFLSINNLPHLRNSAYRTIKRLCIINACLTSQFSTFFMSPSILPIHALKPLCFVLSSVPLLMKAFEAETSSYNLFLCYVQSLDRSPFLVYTIV